MNDRPKSRVYNLGPPPGDRFSLSSMGLGWVGGVAINTNRCVSSWNQIKVGHGLELCPIFEDARYRNERPVKILLTQTKGRTFC